MATDIDGNNLNGQNRGNEQNNSPNRRSPNGYIGSQNSLNPNNYGTMTRPVIDNGYEEFFGGSVQCPSCRGTGRIPRESEHELVALIPVRDKRLKPRRTKLYVLLSIITCCTIAGLLVFFLYPRGFTISSDTKNLIPDLLYINVSKSYVEMTVTSTYNVTNPNFFSMQVTELNGQVFFDQRIMSKASNKSVLHVPMRSRKQHYLTFTIKFDGDEGYIAYYCSEGARFGHTILMPFETKFKTLCMGRDEEVTVSTYEHVKCSPKYVHTTTKKPTTTTTTTITTTTTHKPSTTTRKEVTIVDSL